MKSRTRLPSSPARMAMLVASASRRRSSARAAAAARRPRKQAADRDLPARRGGRPEHGRAVRRGRLLPAAADDRDPTAGRRRWRGDRSRWLLRPASAMAPLKPLWDSALARDRARLRVARHHALALRRAGLHGVGHAGRQGDARRLAQSLPAGVDRRAQPAARRRARRGTMPRSLRASRRRSPSAASTSSACAAPAGARSKTQYAQSADPLLQRRARRRVRSDARRCARRPRVPYRPAAGAEYPRSPFGQALGEIARLAKADVGLEVAFTEIGNWDHHVNEGVGDRPDRQPPRRILARPRGAGDRPRRSHGRHGHRHDVGVRPRRRGERQRRHRPRPRQRDDGHRRQRQRRQVHGTWPGLSDAQRYEGRDLAVTTDFRDVFSESSPRTWAPSREAAITHLSRATRAELIRSPWRSSRGRMRPEPSPEPEPI